MKLGNLLSFRLFLFREVKDFYMLLHYSCKCKAPDHFRDYHQRILFLALLKMPEFYQYLPMAPMNSLILYQASFE